MNRDPAQPGSQAQLIREGKAVLGIELGSTRIKAFLAAPDGTALASGSHAWESQLREGVWTYRLEDVWAGLSACFRALADEVRRTHAVELQSLASLGLSAMEHGYLAHDAAGRLLVPFRTWRNNITGPACAELTRVLDFAIPQRWSIAHLHQSVLEEQVHLPRLSFLTTLAGYVHWQLTGEKVLGVGDASGMFPVDPGTLTWDAERVARFDALVAPRGFPWRLEDLLPRVLPAGVPAGTLSAEGARRLDPTGALRPGIPLCPPEGDGSTGMVATNSVRPRTGNVSAGTSIFAMLVLGQKLTRVHEAIDVVLTPDGSVVGMAHSNNGCGDLDAWLSLLGQAARALGAEVRVEDLWQRLVPLALSADPDAGGLLAVNYLSGEHVTGFTEGLPLFARRPESAFTLPNFVRALLFSALCALRTGMDVLAEEGVVLDELRGHGGLFKGGETAQRMMAAAMGVPVSVPAGAGEGGAWGMALLAAYLLRPDPAEKLPDWLDTRIAGSMGRPVQPDPRDAEGFRAFYARHRAGLTVEAAAVEALR